MCTWSLIIYECRQFKVTKYKIQLKIANGFCFNQMGFQLAQADRDKTDPKHLCTKCHDLLNEPTQTSCGHRYCRGCIHSILRYVADMYVFISHVPDAPAN